MQIFEELVMSTWNQVFVTKKIKVCEFIFIYTNVLKFRRHIDTIWRTVYRFILIFLSSVDLYLPECFESFLKYFIA